MMQLGRVGEQSTSELAKLYAAESNFEQRLLEMA
jgi:hypothetical protein